MPYRRAHWFLLLLFPLVGLAFWPSYWSVLSTVSPAFHIHGFTASLWIVLLACQSWSIHHRRNEWHRLLGWMSLAIFPLFLAGGFLIIHSMAGKVGGGDPFYTRFGARLATIDIIATATIGWLYWSALRSRRKVHPHARYMLATVFFLLSPIIGRLLPILPPLQITGPADLHHFAYSVQIANLLALILALALAWQAPRHGRPWLITAGVIGAQILAFETLGRYAPWEALVRDIALLPAALIFILGLAVGALLSWLGWSAVPPKPNRPAEAISSAI